ncbi:MAG TPA: UvrD-helicase domain-containing protein [Terriglobia bacterium]|nr:UvrD-helicase domain-containing protein [Terriglobia bacterium]
MNLTPQQENFISRFSQGEALACRAVAGSGKTTTLVAAFNASAKPKSRSLVLAFNKRNAEELQAKLPAEVTAMTLNALGHRAYVNGTGLRPKLDSRKLWGIWNEHPQSGKLKKYAEEILDLTRLARIIGLSPGVSGKPGPDYALWEAAADDMDLDWSDTFADIAADILGRSTTAALKGTIDFDDQLYIPVLFGLPFPKFDRIAVDEAQDLSLLQHEMVGRAAAAGCQMVAIGDPNQAIYAWRGASSNSFYDLVRKFSLTEAALTASFRCPRAVVREAQKYVPDIEAAGDFEGSVDFSPTMPIPALRKAVLSRYNAPLVDYAFRAIRQGVGVDYKGRDFIKNLKKIHQKYPTPAALAEWLEHEKANKKTEGARQKAEDKYQSLLSLHANGSNKVEEVIAKLAATPQDQALVLSTIHKAKGLEWDDVTFLDYSKLRWEGQEPNCWYVGCTRAKRALHLHTPAK